MITPLQQTAGIAVSDLMRSMVEAIEDRQREEQEKANSTQRTMRSRPTRSRTKAIAPPMKR